VRGRFADPQEELRRFVDGIASAARIITVDAPVRAAASRPPHHSLPQPLPCSSGPLQAAKAALLSRLSFARTAAELTGRFTAYWARRDRAAPALLRLIQGRRSRECARRGGGSDDDESLNCLMCLDPPATESDAVLLPCGHVRREGAGGGGQRPAHAYHSPPPPAPRAPQLFCNPCVASVLMVEARMPVSLPAPRGRGAAGAASPRPALLPRRLLGCRRHDHRHSERGGGGGRAGGRGAEPRRLPVGGGGDGATRGREGPRCSEEAPSMAPAPLQEQEPAAPPPSGSLPPGVLPTAAVNAAASAALTERPPSSSSPLWVDDGGRGAAAPARPAPPPCTCPSRALAPRRSAATAAAASAAAASAADSLGGEAPCGPGARPLRAPAPLRSAPS